MTPLLKISIGFDKDSLENKVLDIFLNSFRK